MANAAAMMAKRFSSIRIGAPRVAWPTLGAWATGTMPSHRPGRKIGKNYGCSSAPSHGGAFDKECKVLRIEPGRPFGYKHPSNPGQMMRSLPLAAMAVLCLSGPGLVESAWAVD